MAKNWTVKEAVVAVKKGDKEAILDIGRRFPLLLNVLTKNIVLAGDAFVEFVECLPDYDTANKINKKLKDGVESTDDAEDTEDTQEAADDEKAAKGKQKAEKKSAKKDEPEDEDDWGEEEDEEETEDVDYSEMSAQELFKLCKSRGINAEMKKPAKHYISLLNKADKAAKTKKEDVEDDWEDEEEKPAKSKQKPEKKQAAKSKPAKKEEDDDDDEWEI